MICSGESGAGADAAPLRNSWLPLSALFLACSVIAIGLGLFNSVVTACVSCSGLVPLALPWVGAIYYACMALLFRRGVDPFWGSQGGALGIFVHAALISESIVFRHFCAVCVLLALLAGAAATVLIRSHLPSAIPIGLALLLGALSGTVCPVDRIEDVLIRRVWPSRILSQAPSFVDRQILEKCGHDCAVRLLVYESTEACRSCSSIEKRILPGLRRDFPSGLCIHRQMVSRQAAGTALPLILLYSGKSRLVTIEGLPQYSEVWGMVDSLMKDARGR